MFIQKHNERSIISLHVSFDLNPKAENQTKKMNLFFM